MNVGIKQNDSLKKVRGIIRSDQLELPPIVDQQSRIARDTYYVYQELYTLLLYLVVGNVLIDRQIELTYQKYLFLVNSLAASNLGIDLLRIIENNMSDYRQMLLDDEDFEALSNIDKLYQKFETK